MNYTTKNIIAREFRYHRTCLKGGGGTNDKNKDLHESKVRDDCFEMLKQFVKENIIEKGEILRMSAISFKYKEFQRLHNLIEKGHRNHNIKERLVKTFGEDLSFYQKSPNTSELVFGTKDSIYNNIKTKEESLKEAALELRSSIEKFDSQPSWPPDPQEFCQEKVTIPEPLQTFLTHLFSSNTPVSERINRLVTSLAQDIMYGVSRGRIKTVKHMQLGVFVKRKTGSKQAITALNRLGHSISYDEVNSLETAYAERQAQTILSRAYVPSRVQPSVFVTFVYDNCDHNPETLSGVSMHCTNGIIVQVKSARQDSEINIDQIQTKVSKRKSFKARNIEITPYFQSERVAPGTMTTITRNSNKHLELVSKKGDLIWALARYQLILEGEDQVIPGWKGFYQEVTDSQNKPLHEVFYLPAINQSPTKFDTVQEMLKQVKEKASALGLTETDLVLDHAIYAKALEVLHNPSNLTLKNFINLRMGGFHACNVFLAVIGKRFGSAGLKDLMIEARLAGPEQVNRILEGKHYNFGVEISKIVFEALMRLKIESFEKWSQQKGKQHVLTSFRASDEFSQLMAKRTLDTFSNSLEVCDELSNLFNTFDGEIRAGKLGPMAQFWQSYLDMVQILLDFIKSIRQACWDLHLQSTESMLEWIHAYDRTNYIRHFTYYWASQHQLAVKHPAIFEEFQKGNFAVRRTANTFNMLPPDQVIEQTINRDQKGSGGIIGSSTSQGSVQRWVLASHNTATIIADFEKFVGSNDVENSKEHRPKYITDKENAVKRCYDTINSWISPFEFSDSLFCFSSGLVASLEVENDLLNASNIGAQKLNQFITERIESDQTSLYSTITKNSLKTFETQTKVIYSKMINSSISIKADRETFARLLLIQQQRNISLREVLQYELGPLPLSLSNCDGTIRKNQKSKLFNFIKTDIPLCDGSPLNTPIIFDGMVLLQKLPQVQTTFGEISDSLLKKIVKSTSRVTFFTTDNYLQNSIKSMERDRRSGHGAIKLKVMSKDQVAPKQWKKFLRDSENKINLVKFLVSDWSTSERHAPVLEGKDLYVTIKDQGYCITANHGILSIRQVPEISSEQEEADTKMFLCAQFAASLGFDSAEIVTVDSDVSILSLYFQHILSELNMYIQMGSGTKRELFHVTSHNLDESIIMALPGVQALSGCDSTSAVCGIGKVKMFKAICSDDRFLSAAALLGETEDLDPNVADVLEELFCNLYGVKDEIDINEARYRLFCERKKVPEPHRLPPTKDALYLHFKRCNFQVREWKSALQASRAQADPDGNGWFTNEEGALEVRWMENNAAPEEMLEFITCACKKSKCITGKCQCHAVNLKCTVLCLCSSCENKVMHGILNEDHGSDTESVGSLSSNSSEEDQSDLEKWSDEEGNDDN